MGHCTFYKYSSRLMAVLLMMLLFVGTLPAASAAESGNCGDNLTWSLEAGTLTITGSGDMWDFTEPDMAPWYPYREEILRISFPEGLTSIGDIAFYDCGKLTHVVLPDSVERIGNYAFMDCKSLALLDLGTGVRSVGEAAFSDCYALRALDLPASLQSIGMKAFYRCESITSVTVPGGVTEIGVSAFGYCKNLVRADILAKITEIPEFLFYGCEKLTSVSLPEQINKVNEFSFRGCDQLNTVSYDGEEQTLEELKELLQEDVVSNEKLPQTSTGGSLQDNGDGTIKIENITVNQGENASVSTKTEMVYPDNGTVNSEVQVNVNGEDGWKEATDLVTESLKNLMEQIGQVNQNGELPKVDVNVDVKGTDTVDQAFVEAVIGENIQATINTSNGSTWKMDLAEMSRESASGNYNLSYLITNGSESLCTELGTQTCFVLNFASSAEVNAEVLVHLGPSWAYQNATLFQRKNRDLIRHQDVIVDSQGYAHFYLASVDEKTDYYIAMNLPVPEDNAIMPQELLNEQNAIRYEPIEYKITGRTSSWGRPMAMLARKPMATIMRTPSSRTPDQKRSRLATRPLCPVPSSAGRAVGQKVLVPAGRWREEMSWPSTWRRPGSAAPQRSSPSSQ